MKMPDESEILQVIKDLENIQELRWRFQGDEETIRAIINALNWTIGRGHNPFDIEE